MNTKAKTAVVDRPRTGRLFGEETLEQTVKKEDEEAVALVQVPVGHGPRTLQELMLADPTAGALYVRKMAEVFGDLRALSIKMTVPQDWVLFRDKSGEEVAHLCDSGAVKVRKLWGISIFNHRGAPDGAVGDVGLREEVVEDKADKKVKRTVKIAEVWADTICALTGERAMGVPFARRSEEDFTGRGHDQDLKAATRTGIDAKAVRLLTGLRRVPLKELTDAGLDLAHMRKGAGYGTSGDRAAGRTAEAGVPEAAKALGDEILRRVGGDSDAAKQLCREITKGDKPGGDGKVFPGWDSVARLTQQWQVDAAWKKLRTHKTFGDDSREPGESG